MLHKYVTLLLFFGWVIFNVTCMYVYLENIGGSCLRLFSLSPTDVSDFIPIAQRSFEPREARYAKDHLAQVTCLQPSHVADHNACQRSMLAMNFKYRLTAT